MKALEKVGATVLTAPFVLLMIIGISALYGWAASRVWSWHIMPLWSGLPALTWVHCWAIGAFKSMVFGSAVNFRDEKTVEGAAFLGRVIGAILAPVVVVAIAGWLR